MPRVIDAMVSSIAPGLPGSGATIPDISWVVIECQHTIWGTISKLFISLIPCGCSERAMYAFAVRLR